MKKYKLLLIMCAALSTTLSTTLIPSAGQASPIAASTGAYIGSFLVQPLIQVSSTYSSNIYATERNEVDDMIYTVKPSIAVSSDWEQHFLSFSAFGDIGIYQSEDDENYEDYGASTDIRRDISQTTTLSFAADYTQTHLDRRSPNQPASTDEPTTYGLLETEANLKWKPSRLFAVFSAGFQSYDYDNGQTNSGAFVNNQDQNRDKQTASIELGYEFKPGLNTSLIASYETTDYDQRFDSTGLIRDSNGMELIAQLSGDLSPVLMGTLYGGVRDFEYDDTTLSDVTGGTAGVDITWTPSRETEIVFNIANSLRETIIANSSGINQWEYMAAYKTAVTRDIQWGLSAGAASLDFENITREDELLSAGSFIKYFLSPRFALGLSYDFSQRDSTAASNYDSHEVSFNVVARY